MRVRCAIIIGLLSALLPACGEERVAIATVQTEVEANEIHAALERYGVPAPRVEREGEDADLRLRIEVAPDHESRARRILDRLRLPRSESVQRDPDVDADSSFARLINYTELRSRDLERMLRQVGFHDVQVTLEPAEEAVREARTRLSPPEEPRAHVAVVVSWLRDEEDDAAPLDVDGVRELVASAFAKLQADQVFVCPPVAIDMRTLRREARSDPAPRSEAGVEDSSGPLRTLLVAVVFFALLAAGLAVGLVRFRGRWLALRAGADRKENPESGSRAA
ncbi:MAG: hypothetical protein R3F20_13575 [Planctomycetota bacterium]